MVETHRVVEAAHWFLPISSTSMSSRVAVFLACKLA